MLASAVLDDPAPFSPLLIERVGGETTLLVKEVRINAARVALPPNVRNDTSA